MKKKIIALIFIISVLAISVSYSQDIMGTDLTSVNTLPFNDNISKETILNDPDLINSECCSVILQVNDNNTVFSFRRDAQYSADIFIENHTVGDKQIIKQYKNANGYFVQSIVTSDGYVVCIGGSNDGDNNRLIENETYKIVNNTTSFENSSDSLKKIYNILNQDAYGHYIVKAPNGTYYLIFSDRMFNGTLESGQYLSVPNKYAFFRSGNFSLDKNPLEVSVNLAQTDQFGLTRRDVTTFNVTFQDEKTHVDLYASNDDGSGVGMNTADLHDDIFLNGNKTAGKDLPMGPDRVQLASFDLEGLSSFSKTNWDILKFFLIGF